MPEVAAGLVLAAGSGVRFGMPKALARAADGTPWIELACRSLWSGGGLVSLGDLAECALHLVPAGAEPVAVRDHADGMSASLRAGLRAVADLPVAALVVTLVDLPEQSSAAVARVLGSALDPSTLRRAVYQGRVGHPVVIGRAHWASLVAALEGDRGAGTYLAAHGAVTVECSDLGTGADVDLAS